MEDSTVGRTIDGYHITGVLGRGGMGVVYQAEDVALARPVAVKRIDPAFARDKSFLRRFRSEARALARIHSPYIVQVYALRETDIGHIIVMKALAKDPADRYQGAAEMKPVTLPRRLCHRF